LRDLFGALRPAVLLNGSLAIALALAHMALAQFKAEAPIVYLGGMAAVGSLVYTSMFLMLPVSGIESEAARWRNVLLSVRRRFA
jgi:Cu/Ag efflux pump CusA